MHLPRLLHHRAGGSPAWCGPPPRGAAGRHRRTMAGSRHRHRAGGGSVRRGPAAVRGAQGHGRDARPGGGVYADGGTRRPWHAARVRGERHFPRFAEGTHHVGGRGVRCRAQHHAGCAVRVRIRLGHRRIGRGDDDRTMVHGTVPDGSGGAMGEGRRALRCDHACRASPPPEGMACRYSSAHSPFAPRW